jgi:hypothetical protein
VKERVLHPIPISFGQFPDGLLQRKITALMRAHFPALSFLKEAPQDKNDFAGFQFNLLQIAEGEHKIQVSIHVEGGNKALPKKSRASVHWANLFASGQSEVSLIPIVAAVSPLMAASMPNISLALAWNSRIEKLSKRKLLSFLHDEASIAESLAWLRPETSQVLQSYLQLLQTHQGPEFLEIRLATDGMRDSFSIDLQGRGFQELYLSTTHLMKKTKGGWSMGLHATSDKHVTLQAIFHDPALALRKTQSLIVVSGLPYLEIAGKSLKEAV